MPRFFLAALTVGFVCSLPAQAQKTKPKFTNALARETSPYLLMHAHNPTDWHPWGPEAFARAQKENKLIFLSIGYSSCYWCHVMERESFNNEEVARLLREHCICIKVDREERPEIDNVYMTALQELRQSGGWPLSMFLLPDGRPIVGGTYWPREDQQIDGEGFPGFKTIIKIVSGAYKKDPKAVEAQADRLAKATARALERTAIAIVPLDKKLVDETVDALSAEFDKDFGGFGNPERKFRGARFPMPTRLNLLLQVGQRSNNDKLIGMATLTLARMAQGGIYDQLGGGFHRYSTERTWTVPHFEKMLYDNGQLVETYAHAYRLTRNPLFARILRETLAYVAREMTSPAGAFYSSQDAETHHEEGRFYVWTPEELDEALPDKAEAAFARKVFGANGAPNFEKKYHILTLHKTPAAYASDFNIPEKEFSDRFQNIKRKLFAVRDKRDHPFRNDIALTSWSGQMIAGYAAAGQVLGEPAYLQTASRAADFVLAQQRTKDGRLLRTYGAAPGQKPRAAVQGYLEDYAFLVHGLLTLHEATGDMRWLKVGAELTDTMIEHHGDKKGGGFFFTAHDHEKLFARGKDQFDGAQPSGNSVAALNLVRLWHKTGEERYRLEAERTFRALAGTLKSYPAGLTTLALALDRFLVKK